MAQRNLTRSEIDFAVRYGREYAQRWRRTAYHVGHREMDLARRAGVSVPEGHCGVLVVVNQFDVVITAVRSDRRPRPRSATWRTRKATR